MNKDSEMKNILFGLSSMILAIQFSSADLVDLKMRYDSHKLTYDIEKVELSNRIQSKFKLTNIKYDGLKVEEDEVHSVAEFICKNQLNAHSIDTQGKNIQAKASSIVSSIDLESEAKNKVPMVYKLDSDSFTNTIETVICSIETYKGLDDFQL